jgi:hypothetical protein
MARGSVAPGVATRSRAVYTLGFGWATSRAIMERKDPHGMYLTRLVAGRRIQCGCPVSSDRNGTHKHLECVGTIRKGEAYIRYDSLNPAHWTGARFCRPCAEAELGGLIGLAGFKPRARLEDLLEAARVNRDLSIADMQDIRSSVTCPSCGAKVGERCRDGSGSTLAFLHDSRKKS